MKNTNLAYAAAVLAGWSAFAGISRAGLAIPKSVHTADQIEAAVEEAREEGKVVTFLYTRKDSTCGLSNGAGEKILATFRRATVMVYAAAGGDDFRKLPEPVQRALRSEEAGKYVPKTVLYDPAADAVVHILPYASGNEMDKNIREAKRALSDLKKASAPPSRTLRPPAPPAALKADSNREMRTWTSAGGSTVEASIVEEQGPYSVLRTADGASVQILTSRLSLADRAYIDSLKNGK